MRLSGGDNLNKNLLLGKIYEAGLTCQKVSKMIGVSKNAFSHKINGRSYFDTEEIDRLCDVLHIDDNEDKVKIFLT